MLDPKIIELIGTEKSDKALNSLYKHFSMIRKMIRNPPRYPNSLILRIMRNELELIEKIENCLKTRLSGPEMAFLKKKWPKTRLCGQRSGSSRNS